MYPKGNSTEHSVITYIGKDSEKQLKKYLCAESVTVYLKETKCKNLYCNTIIIIITIS